MDYTLNLGVVAEVLGESLEHLVLERAGHHAVDHGSSRQAVDACRQADMLTAWPPPPLLSACDAGDATRSCRCPAVVHRALRRTVPATWRRSTRACSR